MLLAKIEWHTFSFHFLPHTNPEIAIFRTVCFEVSPSPTSEFQKGSHHSLHDTCGSPCLNCLNKLLYAEGLLPIRQPHIPIHDTQWVSMLKSLEKNRARSFLTQANFRAVNTLHTLPHTDAGGGNICVTPLKEEFWNPVPGYSQFFPIHLFPLLPFDSFTAEKQKQKQKNPLISLNKVHWGGLYARFCDPRRSPNLSWAGEYIS